MADPVTAIRDGIATAKDKVDEVTDLAQSAVDQTRQAYKDTRKAALRTYADVRDTTQTQPLFSLSCAAALGFVVGAVWMMTRR